MEGGIPLNLSVGDPTHETAAGRANTVTSLWVCGVVSVSDGPVEPTDAAKLTTN